MRNNEENPMKMTTLCYIEKDGKYLMLHRTKKQHDINKDKWIGVGGHAEGTEGPEDCLLREVKEETGIELTNISTPFALIKNYSKNYRNTGKNRLNLIYYYYFTGSYTPDPQKTNLDTYEIEGNYHTIYIPLSCFKTTINKTIHLDPINPIMYHEMSLIIDLLNKKIK